MFLGIFWRDTGARPVSRAGAFFKYIYKFNLLDGSHCSLAQLSGNRYEGRWCNTLEYTRLSALHCQRSTLAMRLDWECMVGELGVRRQDSPCFEYVALVNPKYISRSTMISSYIHGEMRATGRLVTSRENVSLQLQNKEDLGSPTGAAEFEKGG